MAYNPFDRTRSPSSSPSLAATQASNTLEDFDPVPWLKKAMDCKLKGVMFHSNASRSAHMMGLQGMKRWHRCQMKDDFKQLVELQHYTIDQFGVNYDPEFEATPGATTITDTQSLLKAYNEYESKYYGIMSDIANQLTLGNYSNEAGLIRDILCGVAKELEKSRRWYQDFEKANWDWAYIRIVDAKLHDKVKEQEEA